MSVEMMSLQEDRLPTCCLGCCLGPCCEEEGASDERPCHNRKQRDEGRPKSDCDIESYIVRSREVLLICHIGGSRAAHYRHQVLGKALLAGLAKRFRKSHPANKQPTRSGTFFACACSLSLSQFLSLSSRFRRKKCLQIPQSYSWSKFEQQL